MNVSMYKISVPVFIQLLTALSDVIAKAEAHIKAKHIDESFMLKRYPGIFVAGEMLDWDAPTGGYLLQATFATGVAAARGAIEWLNKD